MSGTVALTQSGSIATLTLTSPGKRNAMSRAMWQQLRSAIDSCLRPIDKDLAPIRCIIVRGEAGHFCAGGDISEYPDFRFNEETLRAFHENLVAPALHALLACDVLLVAQIEGNCMGGGLEIAACCDIRIAGQGATFGAPIAKLGMSMAPKELAIVLRAAGEATVREMLLEARIFNAEQMQQRGFVQRLVADDTVVADVQATAQRMCALSPQAARLNKQALRQFFLLNSPIVLVNRTQAATNTIAIENNPYAYADSPEHVEGITAFLEKRSPQF
jgi:enoyl-CoA hydratase